MILRHLQSNVYTFLLLLSLWLSVEAQCPVCGSLGPDTVPLLDKELGINGIPVETCGTMEGIALALAPDSDFCGVVQSVGTLCGCNIPPEGCTLCWDGSPVGVPDVELPNYAAADYVPSSLPVTGVLNCETLQALLHTTDTQGSSQCLAIQQDVGVTCGCPQPPIVTNPTMSPTAVNSTDATATMAPVVDTSNNATDPIEEPPAVERCSLCPDGGVMAFPDKVLALDDATSNTTCRQWESFAAAVTTGSSDCELFGNFALYCGCTIENKVCSLCPNGEAVPNPTRENRWFFEAFVSTRKTTFQSRLLPERMNCDLMASIVATEWIESLAALFDLDSDLYCMAVQLRSWICGCSPDWRQYLLTWCYRISGMLSFLGSSLIVYDVLSKPKKNRFTTYHQIVLGISFFDIVGSLAYILVAVLAPHEAGFHLSRGNEATCTLQGFMIQLGQTSMFYNICLSFYFLLVISFNWKENQLRRFGRWSQIVSIVLGAGLAFGSIPFIGPQFGVCGVLPPLTTSEWQVSSFYTVPVSVTLIVLAVVTVAICHKVYQQQKKAQRWRMNQRLTLTRKVFWQSFWYVSAFYLTLPFVLFTFYIEFTTPDHYWLLVLAAVLAPLQGFMNTLVYFQRSRRKKMFKSMCQCFRRPTKPTEEKLPPQTEVTDNNSVRPDVSEGPSVTFGAETTIPSNTEGDLFQDDGTDVNVKDDEKDSEPDRAPRPKRSISSERMRISGVTEHWMLNEEWDTSLFLTAQSENCDDDDDYDDDPMVDDGDYESVSDISRSRSLGSFRNLFRAPSRGLMAREARSLRNFFRGSDSSESINRRPSARSLPEKDAKAVVG